MAAKRFAKSSLDWAAFVERIRPEEKVKFQNFKAKVDGYTQRMMSYPVEPPKIDFETYRKRLPNPALVDEFEKQFKAVKVPYPEDKLTAQIDAQEKKLDVALMSFKEITDLKIKYFEKRLQWWKDMLPMDEMTMEELFDYFPDPKLNPYKTPSFWPHDEPGRPVFPYRGQK
ncbi:hypothetical protein JTE90_023171 [Oedothorax gibbosus]|uniref:ATP synthase subunit d, mitochondrial n=1 Tax=Oedothorax gibbosus TaxID=931172 RepID=A0AAV6UGB0_9ARAC|nr:hypothetical protein JTE90_023171 [Oedothorax gibbosus]